MVTLLHRLENEGWIIRKASPHDRRCKMVFLGRRAQNVISQISAEAEKLRGELMENISATDLRTCMRVLTQIYEKAEGNNGNGGPSKFRFTVRK